MHDANAAVPKVAIHPNAVADVSSHMDAVKSSHITWLQPALIDILEASDILNRNRVSVASISPKIPSQAKTMTFCDADVARAVQDFVWCAV